MTADGDSVVWKLSYAGKASGVRGKLVGTVIFMTMSEKLAWLNHTICVLRAQAKQIPPNPERTCITVELTTHIPAILHVSVTHVFRQWTSVIAPFNALTLS